MNACIHARNDNLAESDLRLADKPELGETAVLLLILITRRHIAKYISFCDPYWFQRVDEMIVESFPTSRKRKLFNDNITYDESSFNKIDKKVLNGTEEKYAPVLLCCRPFPAYTNGVAADRFPELSALVQHCSHLELVHLTTVIQPLLKRDFLSYLPYEIGQHILAYMNPKDLLQCAKVLLCGYFRFLKLT